MRPRSFLTSTSVGRLEQNIAKWSFAVAVGLKWDRMAGDAQTKTSQDLIESWDVR